LAFLLFYVLCELLFVPYYIVCINYWTLTTASDRQGVNLVSFKGFGTFLNCVQIVFLTEVTCV